MTIFAQTLTNPGAESGSTTGWTSFGDTLIQGTSINGIGPFAGSRLFGHDDGFSEATGQYQNVAVDPGLEAAIDAGVAGVRISGHTNNDGADLSRLRLQCYDGSMVELDSLSTNLTPSSPVNTWFELELYNFIPPLTRTIRIGTNNVTNGVASRVRWDVFEMDISDEGEADWPAQLAPKSQQVAVYAWATSPAEQLRNTQEAVYAFAASETSTGLFHVKSHQVGVYAWVRGYVERPHVRAWTFSLDGHDFYVLRLGTLSTIVLDLATGQWAEWRGHNLPYWRAVKGQNWLGMGPDTANRLFGTNIVAGDDRVGTLWMLDPTTGVDDGSTDDSEQVSFTRASTAIVPQRMRNTTPIGGIYVTLSLGEPSITGAAITLRVSRDWGQSYQDVGTITIDPSNYSQEIAWRSLGLIRAPGMIFELSDDGAAVRINDVEMK